MDNAIQILKVSKLEIKDIQLDEDLEKEVKLAPPILHQNNHEAENLDADVNVDEDKAKENNLAWVEGQYPTPNLLVFEAFLANSVGLSVKTIDSSESEGEDCSYKQFFIAITVKKEPEYCTSKSAMMTQLKKQ